MRSPLSSGRAFRSGRSVSSLAGLSVGFGATAFALWAAWALVVGSPVSATPSFPASPLLTSSFPDYGDAVADLDGDGRPDLATVRSRRWGANASRYQVELTLSAGGGPSSFSVSAEAGGLRIIPRDVDGDGDLDLVITSTRSLAPVGVWINDGHGIFTRGDPTAYAQSIWTEGPGIFSHHSQRTFSAIAPQWRWPWLDFSKAFRFRSELPIARLRFFSETSSLPEVAISQPRTRSPPFSLPRLTS
jgi:hypothetical protein